MKHRAVILQVLTFGLTLSMLVFPAAMLRASQTTVPAFDILDYTVGQTGAGGQSPVAAIPEGTFCPADLIAYLKLEEPGNPSGPLYADVTEDHPGICRAGTACPSETSGLVGSGQAFNGSSTGIDIPAHRDFDWDRTDSWSVELWMRTDESSNCQGTEVLVGRNAAPSSFVHWWVGCEEGGVAGFLAISEFQQEYALSGTTDLTDGNWHHIAAVRNAAALRMSIFVDGMEESWVRTSPDFWGGFMSAEAEINIGWLDSWGRYHFDGLIDEVAIYDRALGISEIWQHSQDGPQGQGYCATPAVAIDKTANPAVRVGETATYTYLVTNAGDAALSNIQVTDDRCSPLSGPTGDDDGDNQLDLAEAWTYSCAQSLSVDTTNTATVVGSHSFGGTVSASDTFTVRVVSPQIAVDKTADPMAIYPGDTVTYDYQVTNPGNDPLSAITVVDDKCSPLSGPTGDLNVNSQLDPGETWLYTCTQTLTADTTNTVTASGTDSTGATVSAQDQVSVNVILSEIAVDKTANKEAALSGETITYNYAVTNPGDDPLSNVQINDDKCAPLSGPTGDSNGNAKLDPGETWTYICDMVVTSDILNTATVSGIDSAGGTVNATDSVLVDVVGPQIAVDKTVNKQSVKSGDTVTYGYAVRNPGDDPLSNVQISDDKCSPVTGPTSGDSNDNSKLDPGEMWPYSCSMVLSADTTNTATVTGTHSAGGTVNGQDVVTVDVAPGLGLTKVAVKDRISEGQVAIYNYAVTNLRDDAVTLSKADDVAIEDDKCQPVRYVSGDSNFNGRLDLAETWEYICSMVLDQTTTNTAIARGTVSSGGQVLSAEIQETVTVGDFVVYLPMIVKAR